MDRDPSNPEHSSRVGVPNLRAEQRPRQSEEPSTAERCEPGSHEQLNCASFPHAVVLRVELRGLERTAEQSTPQSMLSMLEEYVDFVGTIARENGGDIYRVEPESVTVGFGLREAKANGSATAAVRAAQRLLEDFPQVSDRWRESTDVRVALSIGIHEGEVLATSPESDPSRTPALVGDTVNVAARLAQRARAGEAVLSATIREALRGRLHDLQIKPLGTFSFASGTQQVGIYCIPRARRLDLGEQRRTSVRH